MIEKRDYEMKRIKLTGTGRLKAYSGWDEDAKNAVELKPGDVADVSEAKAAQLMADFPTDFEITDLNRRKDDGPAVENKAIAAAPETKGRGWPKKKKE